MKQTKPTHPVLLRERERQTLKQTHACAHTRSHPHTHLQFMFGESVFDFIERERDRPRDRQSACLLCSFRHCSISVSLPIAWFVLFARSCVQVQDTEVSPRHHQFGTQSGKGQHKLTFLLCFSLISGNQGGFFPVTLYITKIYNPNIKFIPVFSQK